MSDLLQDGLDWLEEQRREHLSRTVTYRRGASSVDVPATVGDSPWHHRARAHAVGFTQALIQVVDQLDRGAA